jgi:hypothetical protein
MNEVQATTQYRDYTGTVSCDGHNAGLLNRLAQESGVPDDVFAVGIDIYVGEGDYFGARLIVVDRSKYGDSIDNIRAHADANGHLEVRLIDLKIEPKKLLDYVKRLNLVVKNRNLADVPFMTDDDP